MAGSKALRKLQLGVETTAGTAVAATAIWRGLGVLNDEQKPEFVEEDVGYLSGTDRSYIPFLLAGLEMEDTPATFEQLPYILSAGIKNVVSGSADGAGSGKVYAYPLPTTSKNTIKTYTIEGGDDQQAEEMEYAFVESFKLSGKVKEALMMSAAWKGRQSTPASFTGALTLDTVEEILFQKGKLYIDTAGGTVGTTQKTQTLLGMELEIATGWMPVFTGDGNLYFTFAKSTRPEVTLKITFEHDGTAVAEKAAWRAKTARQIRVLFEGTALATSGDYTYKTLQIDLAGKWETFDKLGEQDGNDIVTGTFVGRYNATADLFTEITVVNEVATLP